MAAEVRYDMTVHPTHALVRSQSDGATAHQVTFPSCDCADFINRRGHLIEAGDGIAVTLCKHIAEGLRRIGGWNRPAEPELRPVLYPVLTRGQAETVLTSHYISASLTNQLLLAACGANGMWVVEDISTGPLSATYDKNSRRYAVRVPGAQPLHVPSNASAFLVGQRA